MTAFENDEVEKWLDHNGTFFKEYFLRKADINLINQWLSEHGFLILCQGNLGSRSPVFLGPPSSLSGIGERRNSSSSSRRASGTSVSGTSGTISPASPGDRVHDFPVPQEEEPPTTNGSKDTCINWVVL
ncbi:unnamed protein product [Orchesella dallaii]|uniref:Uncharacterized protein n=1 Tax=Orchesella dallaii TaxID=48710 RepID=A0ABP1QW95_9HEXA